MEKGYSIIPIFHRGGASVFDFSNGKVDAVRLDKFIFGGQVEASGHEEQHDKEK